MDAQDIFSFITTQETAFALPIKIEDGWEWNMREHIKLSILYKNSKFSTGNNDGNRPYKNIIRPILNLQYRAEGFDVKDIVLFVNDRKNYFKSFLIKKFHEQWARENKIDTFIDKMVESYVDFGGVLVKNVNEVRPEVVSLQSIVFCDQTDILSGPIGIKHYFSPDQLREMEAAGWGNESYGATHTLDDVITLSQAVKKRDTQGKEVPTPGKYIEVYEVHGTLPEKFLGEKYSDDENGYCAQMQIVCFYQTQDMQKQGIVLWKGKEKESPFKLILRDEIFGLALGLGGAEELFEPQVWVNYDQIRMKDMLDAVSKVVHLTDDETFYSRNRNLRNIKNNEVLHLADGKTVRQMDTYPRNIAIFEKSVQQWEAHAQQMGAAGDAIMGESPSAGTPFKLQELVTQEAHGIHEYRKGKLATFLDEIYKDWIIPHIVKEITKGQEFVAELDFGEMQGVAEQIAENRANRERNNQVLNGDDLQDKEVIKQQIRDEFMRGGSKKFLEIIKGEMKGTPVDVSVNIAGKQKNLSAMTDKVVNIFRQIFANPQGFLQVMQIPAAASSFNEILEFSGMSPIDFGGIKLETTQQPINQPAMAT